VITPKSPQLVLQEIAQIQKMERGKLSVIRESPSGPFYKLQARENGKNLTRYVPRVQAPAVQEAIEGYQRFEALTEQYARLVIDKTRAEIASASKKTKPRPKSSSPRMPRSGS
jgi:hypothetical protein